jgi:hypothetical protein
VCAVIRLRLVKGEISDPFHEFDKVFDERKKEADDFYHECKRRLMPKTQNLYSDKLLPV